jgi:hypothetical protein
MPAVIERALRAQAPNEEPATPSVAQRGVGNVFRALSALRQSRSVHPDGVVFEATFDVPRAGYRSVPILGQSGSKPAVVRLSRSIGLPQPLPDLLGCTIRLVDAHGSGRHQDFPLITSSRGPLLHHLLLPAKSFLSLPYSSVLLYRIGEDVRLVGALPVTEPLGGGTDFDQLRRTADQKQIALDLAVASPFGSWRPVGRLSLGAQVPVDVAQYIRFNPWNTGGGIRPMGPFMGLRAGAYRGSQEGWSAEGARP